MKTFVPLALAGALSLSLATAAHADFPTFYSDQGDFHAQGTIVETADFDGFDTNITVLANDLTVGPLTFHGDPLVVVGTDSYLNPVRNVITNNLVAEGTDIDIDLTGFNMLAFQLTNLQSYGEQVFLQLLTNVDTYYYGLYPGPAPENLSFYGFVVPEGEYFTGLKFNHTEANQVFGTTAFELGTTAQVCDTRVCDGGPSPAPEPTAWALMILGFGGAGAALRRGRRTSQRAAWI